MSDGFPTLGPKVARPSQGMPRNDPGVDLSGNIVKGTGAFFSPGGTAGYGIVVLPWNLVKESAVRTINVRSNVGAFNVDMEVDAAWYTVR